MPASALAETLAPPLSRRLDGVRASRDIADVREAWDALLAVTPASAYQTPGWIAPWLATRGAGLDPCIAVGFDRHGPVALLPLGRTRRAGVTVARFLGGRDANFGLGLLHPDLAWTAEVLRDLLDATARQGGIDLFWFANQPDTFAGRPNPMAVLPHRPSPSRQHEAVLDRVPDAYLARTLSARARKHIRQKEAKLAALGPVRHARSRDGAPVAPLAAALVAQHAARFEAGAGATALRAFLAAAAGEGRDGAPPAVELHALLCGETPVATFAGAGHAGRFSGMMLSITSDPAWARFSPGELLLARIITEKCREGVAVLDLGVGEARYKAQFCPVEVPLFETVLGTTARGRAAAACLAAGLAAKRRIKGSPRLWAAVGRLRALGRPRGTADPSGRLAP